jgi:hypothetical protein
VMDLQETREEGPKGPIGFDPDALTRALRIAGATLVVASASTFMLQHWQNGDDLWRYAMLVGQSLLLAAAAYFVGLTLREGRSARTLLALVLATMPVSFAVLGGLVYSQFHLDALAPLPFYATWVAPTPASALLAVAGTLALLVPLALVSFLALARKQAKLLTALFFAANLLLLVPIRQPLTIAVLAGLALIALVRLELKRFAGVAQLDTLEGRLARAVLFAPPLIMLGRVLHLYQGGAAFVGSLLLIGAAMLWCFLPRVHEFRRNLGAWIAAGLASTGWVLCWTELTVPLDSAALRVLLLGLPLALGSLLGALRATSSRPALVGLGLVQALLSTVIACAVDLGSISALACILLGVAVAVWGASVRAMVRTVAGACVALFGLAVQVWLAVNHDNLLRWISLSVVGVLLIVGSAYVERNRASVLRWWQNAVAKRLRAEEDEALVG